MPENVSPRPFLKNIANFGDCALVDAGKGKTISIILKKDEVTQTRYGALKHNDCVEKLYGSKIATSNGFVYLIALNPVLWSEAVLHRTQIIYTTDASVIIGQLDLRPGMRVFEAGTGSGSLTHFLVQSILPNGFVTSFDFHIDRVNEANKEFEIQGLSNWVAVCERDVCSNYFPVFGDDLNTDGVNAVMLDLPNPWTIVPHLSRSFAPNSVVRVCVFCPCIEQVERSCQALRSCGFVHITTMECLKQDYDLIRSNLPIPNLGQINVSDWIEKPDDLNVYFDALPKHNPDYLKLSCVSSESGNNSEQVSNKNNCSDTVWEPLLKTKQLGHTGYLTFASWLSVATMNSHNQVGSETP